MTCERLCVDYTWYLCLVLFVLRKYPSRVNYIYIFTWYASSTTSIPSASLGRTISTIIGDVLVKMYSGVFNKMKKIHFSCEINQKFFLIKNQLCKLHVVIESRVLRRCVYPREGYYSRSVTSLLMAGSTGLRRSTLLVYISSNPPSISWERISNGMSAHNNRPRTETTYNPYEEGQF